MLSHNLSADIIKEAAQRGIGHAHWMLSRMYRFGVGVEPSPELSDNHLEISFQQGNMRASRDYAMKSLSGQSSNISTDEALKILSDLGESGFSRTEIGEKLVFSGRKNFVEQGFDLLKLEALQECNWKARYLSLLCEAFNNELPEETSEQKKLLIYLTEAEQNKKAEHASILKCFLNEDNYSVACDKLVTKLLGINSPESTLDAWEILRLPTFRNLDDGLRRTAFAQLTAHALAGHEHSAFNHLLILLENAHPQDQFECAMRILKLMREFPQFHTMKAAVRIHDARVNVPELSEYMLETLCQLAKSKLAPYANKNAASELLLWERFEESEKHHLRATELGVDNSIHSLAVFYFARYHYQGEEFENARFWSEALVFDDFKSGQDLVFGLLDSRNHKTKLSNEEALSLRGALEYLSRKNVVYAKHNLALLLIKGNGPVLPEVERGLALLKSAAETDGRAMYELGHMYQAGVYVSHDMLLAGYYFEEAAKNGHSNGQYIAKLAEQEEVADSEEQDEDDESENSNVFLLIQIQNKDKTESNQSDLPKGES